MSDRQKDQDGRTARPTTTNEEQAQYQQVLEQLSPAEDAEALELIQHAGGIPTI
jgi:hypothetical protein